MKVITLLLAMLCATFTYAQQQGQFYYRSVVDNLMQANCQDSRTIDPSEIEHDPNGFIRFRMIQRIYNPTPPINRNRVKFILVEDHGPSIRVSQTGFCTIYLTIPLRNHKTGKHYAILQDKQCPSLIEYEYQNKRVTSATLYQCCSKPQ